MEESSSIRFRRGRRSSLANAQEFNQLAATHNKVISEETVVEAELLELSDGSSSDDESDQVPNEFKLMYVAHEGDLDAIKHILESGANVNYRDYDGRTALHIAACQGYSEVVQLLIDSGAEVNATDRWGSTPLADAIHYKSHQVIALLEKHSAALPADPCVKKEDKDLEFEIDSQELDFTNSIDIAKGTVRIASWRGIEVAVKQVDDISFDEDQKRAFRDELALLQRVRHPNVVQFLGAVTQTSPKMIVTEYLPKGDLRQYLKDKGPLKPREAVKYALDFARGMGYLHQHKPEPIIHGDLDSSNILWDVSGNLKVADFGVSKLLKLAKGIEDYKPDTCRYMAPELFRNEGYDTKVDVFSFALILQEMIEGCPPFSDKDEVEVAEAYANQQRPPFKASGRAYAHGLKELIEHCWSKDPAERPTFGEIIIRLDKITNDIGHKKRWKVQIYTISKNLSVLPFKFHHRR